VAAANAATSAAEAVASLNIRALAVGQSSLFPRLDEHGHKAPDASSRWTAGLLIGALTSRPVKSNVTGEFGVINQVSALEIAAANARTVAAGTKDTNAVGGGAWFNISAPPLPSMMLGLVRKQRSFFSIGAFEAEPGVFLLSSRLDYAISTHF
jgi:hypothetical protein